MFTDLIDFIKSIVEWSFDKLHWFFVTFINLIVTVVSAFVSFCVDLLPSSAPSSSALPGLAVPDVGGNSFLGILNWFLPMNHIVLSLGFYLSAVLLYFSIAPLLRWVKVLK